MWSGQLHDPDFIGKVLEHLESSKDRYGTAARMKGMLTVAQEVRIVSLGFFYLLIIGKELQTPFYFTPSRVSSHFHCRTPSLDVMASVVLTSRIFLPLMQLLKVCTA
jgi:tRNA (guanine26-N2/guanine27-N2)-dimethyltransferase